MLFIGTAFGGGDCPHMDGLKNMTIFNGLFRKVWSIVEDHHMHGKNIAFECY